MDGIISVVFPITWSAQMLDLKPVFFPTISTAISTPNKAQYFEYSTCKILYANMIRYDTI